MFKKTPESGSHIESSGTNWLTTAWKKILTAVLIWLAGELSAGEANTTPANIEKSNNISYTMPDNSEATNAALFDDFSIVSDSIENPRSIEARAQKYVNDNVYFNWKKISELWATIEKKKKNENTVECSIKFDYELNNWQISDWTMAVDFGFNVWFADGEISIDCNGYSFKTNVKTTTWKIADDEKKAILSDDGNLYEVLATCDWKTCNFLATYNKYWTTWNIIKNVQEPKLGKVNAFPESVPELKKLNNCMYLWNEVHKEKEGDHYTRDLFWAIWKKYIKILSIPFNKDGETDWVEMDVEILGITVHISVDKNWNVSMSKEDQDKLAEKLRKDKYALASLFDENTDPTNEGYFSWLTPVVLNWEWWTPLNRFFLVNPILWLFGVNYNDKVNESEIKLRVDWNEKISTADSNWNPVQQIFINFNKHHRYQAEIEGNKFHIGDKRRPWENPQDRPTFSWDEDVVSILNKAEYIWNENWNYSWYTENGESIVTLPFEISEWKLKVKDVTVSLNPYELYNYEWYNYITSQITKLSKELWITDSYILDIFEELLRKEKVDFTIKWCKATNYTDQDNISSKYCTVSQSQPGDDVKLTENSIYSDWLKVLKTMVERLNYLNEIMNRPIKKQVWYSGLRPVYEDFTKYNWWIDRPSLIRLPIEDIVNYAKNEGEINQIMTYWDWQFVEIRNNESTSRLSKNMVKIGINEYDIKIVGKDIVFKPIKL